MSYERVKAYFESVGIADHLSVNEEVGDTVEHAAALLGCEPARIAKTMSYMLKSGPILIVSAGDAKVNSSKFKQHFHEKAVMVPWDQVEETIGHVPGAVTPFALNEGVRVYLDVSLKRFDTIHAAGGSLNSTVRLTLAELEKYSDPVEWVDICNGWLANGGAVEDRV